MFLNQMDSFQDRYNEPMQIQTNEEMSKSLTKQNSFMQVYCNKLKVVNVYVQFHLFISTFKNRQEIKMYMTSARFYLRA